MNEFLKIGFAINCLATGKPGPCQTVFDAPSIEQVPTAAPVAPAGATPDNMPVKLPRKKYTSDDRFLTCAKTLGMSPEDLIAKLSAADTAAMGRVKTLSDAELIKQSLTVKRINPATDDPIMYAAASDSPNFNAWLSQPHFKSQLNVVGGAAQSIGVGISYYGSNGQIKSWTGPKGAHAEETVKAFGPKFGINSVSDWDSALRRDLGKGASSPAYAMMDAMQVQLKTANPYYQKILAVQQQGYAKGNTAVRSGKGTVDEAYAELAAKAAKTPATAKIKGYKLAGTIA